MPADTVLEPAFLAALASCSTRVAQVSLIRAEVQCRLFSARASGDEAALSAVFRFQAAALRLLPSLRAGGGPWRPA